MKRIITVHIFFLIATSYALGQKDVEVLSYKLDTVTNHKCDKWNYPTKNVLDVIISEMMPLTGEEHHGCYNNYSCSIEGIVIYKGKAYQYYLNAGGWIRLVSSDYKIQFLLACDNKKYFKYFLSVKDCKGVSGG